MRQHAWRVLREILLTQHHMNSIIMNLPTLTLKTLQQGMQKIQSTTHGLRVRVFSKYEVMRIR